MQPEAPQDHTGQWLPAGCGLSNWLRMLSATLMLAKSDEVARFAVIGDTRNSRDAGVGDGCSMRVHAATRACNTDTF